MAVLQEQPHPASLPQRRTTTSNAPIVDFETAPSEYVSFFCGLIAGVAQAGLFNPYDRALYLSVKHKRPFLSSLNFQSPYQGFLQSVGGRALSGGLYYPLEHLFCRCAPDDTGPWTNFISGTAAGAANALLLNPLSALKYKTWGRETNRGMLTEAVDMWHKAGIRPFFNGLQPTLLRDVVFGGCYTYLRYKLRLHHDDDDDEQSRRRHHTLSNVMAAAVATIASGPFNLVRNVQYATRSQKIAPTIMQVLKKLMYDVSEKETFGEKWHHVQSRLRIGWGTARVAVGMAFGQLLYDQCMGVYQQQIVDGPS